MINLFFVVWDVGTLLLLKSQISCVPSRQLLVLTVAVNISFVFLLLRGFKFSGSYCLVTKCLSRIGRRVFNWSTGGGRQHVANLHHTVEVDHRLRDRWRIIRVFLLLLLVETGMTDLGCLQGNPVHALLFSLLPNSQNFVARLMGRRAMRHLRSWSCSFEGVFIASLRAIARLWIYIGYIAPFRGRLWTLLFIIETYHNPIVNFFVIIEFVLTISLTHSVVELYGGTVFYGDICKQKLGEVLLGNGRVKWCQHKWFVRHIFHLVAEV